MARRLPDLIEAWLKFAENTESPISYHTWACISTVSALLERRVWIQWGHTRIFPNQYIVLIGPSGARKREPLTVSRDFLESLRLELISEDPTRQAMIGRMKNAARNFEYGGFRIHSPIACIVEELAVFLGESDMKFLADLTNWYDCPGLWTYETRTRSIDKIQGVCVNILGSMAPDWIPVAIPQGAIGGGFTSRILFIVEHTKGKTITDPNEVQINTKLQEDMRRDFEAVHKLVGEFRFDSDALEEYKAWYEQEEKKTAVGRPAISDPRFGGYVSRRATHVKKIAMAVSAARADSLRISSGDFRRSLLLMEKAEEDMPSVFGKLGRSVYSEQTQEVLDIIKRRGRVLKSEIMQMFYRDIDSRTLEIIESTLRATKLVRFELLTGSNDVAYIWHGGRDSPRSDEGE